jgi:hypothetical protein
MKPSFDHSSTRKNADLEGLAESAVKRDCSDQEIYSKKTERWRAIVTINKDDVTSEAIRRARRQGGDRSNQGTAYVRCALDVPGEIAPGGDDKRWNGRATLVPGRDGDGHVPSSRA